VEPYLSYTVPRPERVMRGEVYLYVQWEHALFLGIAQMHVRHAQKAAACGFSDLDWLVLDYFMSYFLV
jgi:hypothetical protein